MASVDYYATWQARFEANIYRHPKMSWENFQAKLTENDSWEKAMIWMEDTDGEPDLVVLESLDKPIVVDMSKASPSGRRSLCYDKEAREKRKKNAPESSVMEEAERFGVEVVDEDDKVVCWDDGPRSCPCWLQWSRSSRGKDAG